MSFGIYIHWLLGGLTGQHMPHRHETVNTTLCPVPHVRKYTCTARCSWIELVMCGFNIVYYISFHLFVSSIPNCISNIDDNKNIYLRNWVRFQFGSLKNRGSVSVLLFGSLKNCSFDAVLSFVLCCFSALSVLLTHFNDD